MNRSYTIPRGALDGVEAFVRVAERRSFRRAATDLEVSPSAVSQTVRALEERLGVALFTRTTRSVGLTEAGERFLERARPAFDEIIAASNAARGLGAKPSGLLRLAVPGSIMPIFLQSVLASFSAVHPEVMVEVVASGELVDLAKSGFDAGIRLGELIAADMIAIRLTPPLRLIMVGSPDYFARSGCPALPGELAHHAFVRLRRSDGTIAPLRILEAGEPSELAVSGPMIVNDIPTMLAAAMGGVGLAQVPAPTAKEFLALGQLQEVLADYATTLSGMFLYFPNHAHVMPKLRVFIDHVKSYAAANMLKRT
ncbi:MAG: LysR family transcriptional regulator [Pseudomonadota bacterium]